MGVSGQHHAAGRALPPGKGPPVPVVQEAGWAPEPVWTQRLEEKFSASVGARTPVVQSVVRHYTDRATPAPEPNQYLILFRFKSHFIYEINWILTKNFRVL
jgi:hypothetical protein